MSSRLEPSPGTNTTALSRGQSAESVVAMERASSPASLTRVAVTGSPSGGNELAGMSMPGWTYLRFPMSPTTAEPSVQSISSSSSSKTGSSPATAIDRISTPPGPTQHEVDTSRRGQSPVSPAISTGWRMSGTPSTSGLTANHASTSSPSVSTAAMLGATNVAGSGSSPKRVSMSGVE